MIFHQVAVGPMQNFAYLIGDEKTGTAAVVDATWEPERLMDLASKNSLRIAFLIATHGHPDHVSGMVDLSKKTGAKIVSHQASEVPKDIVVRDGDTIKVGSLTVRFIHTPGHSPDGVCVLVDNKLMTGDTLFVGECGRTDLPGGSAEQLYKSFFDKLLKLPDELEVYPGHNYGARPSSTIGYEKAHNYVLKPRTLRQFLQFMKEP